MTASKKLLALLLAALMLASCMLTGCNNGTATDTDPAESTAGETEALETEAPARTAFDLITDGVANVKVVRPDGAATADACVQCAMDIRTKMLEYCGTSGLKIDTDWVKPGTAHDSSAIEILVGMTDYDETAEAAANLKFGDYVVSAVGNKIVVLGFTDAAMNYASTIFINMVKAAAVQNEATKTYTVSLNASEINKTGTKDAVISSLPSFDNGTFYATYDPGDDCDEVIIRETDLDAYNAYVEKLKSNGYTQYTQRTVEGNTFTTLYSDKYTINIGYYKTALSYNKPEVRIIMEPFSQETLIGLESDNKYTAVTTSQITSLGLEYVASDGSYTCNGLSVLIRLTDGRFIVVDGGFNREKDATMLINLMKSQSADYVSKTGGIKVAAWIITHAHGDHLGMIGKKYNLFTNNKITVERFLVNFMSDAERNKAISSYLASGSSNWSSSEGSGYANVITAAAALDADLVTVHVGQVFYFADLALEVLYTIESYGPTMTNALNTTSLIMKMTFTDATTKEQTVYMSTGDATGPGFKITNALFGSYLKSDIVQVAHHGYTTWGTEEGTIAAYKSMAPATLLWPQGGHAYPNYVNKSYNSVLWNTSTNPNYKETYVAGTEGQTTVYPIPYKVGSAIVTTP